MVQLNTFIVASIFLTLIFIVIPSSHALKKGGNRTKIYDGEDASAEEFPYMVAIVDKEDFIWCGAIIITEQFLLTAANCHSPQFRQFKLIAGAIYIDQVEASWQVRKISKFVKHPDYDSDTDANDIAVIFIKTAFIFDNFVQAITVSTNANYPTGEAVTIGWGTINDDDDYPEVLQKVTLNIVEFDTCFDAYDSVPCGVVCAAAPDKDSCGGDEGGPLVQDDQLIGIVSFGKGCADPLYPGGYTFVPIFHSFIQKTILKYAPKKNPVANIQKPNNNTTTT